MSINVLMPNEARAPSSARVPGKVPQAIAPDFNTRVRAVADIAAQHADSVDRESRFPKESFDALRAHRLLAVLVPRQFGGEEASIQDVSDMCYALGRVCSSTALIFAMHHIKLACLVRHGTGSAWLENLMRRVAAEQMLLASSTTEGMNGGNVRSSAAAVERDGAGISLNRAATVMSYGREADGLLTVARRAPDTASSDQVLVAFTRDDYTLEWTGGWETLGMRGTGSAGFDLKAHGVADQVFAESYDKIHAQTMIPYAHICWGSTWAGIAAAAVDRAQAFVRKAARQSGGKMPPGASHVTSAKRSLNKLRAFLTSSMDHFSSIQLDEKAISSLAFQSAITLLKVEASELALATVMSSVRACGLSGYRTDGEFSVGRQLRDILSAPLMINNDRILANIETVTLMSGAPLGLRD